MKGLEDILWKDGSPIEDNDISGNDSEFEPAGLPYNCMMICCTFTCETPENVSTFGCK